jgi:phage-related holin
MDMSLNNINNEIIKKKLGNKESNENNYDLEFFLEKIPKTTIHFKQHYVLENEQEEEEKADRTGINSEEKEEALNRESVSSYNSNQRTESIDISAEISDINQEYKKELTLDRIYEKIVNEEKGEIKDLYLYQLEQIGNDPDLFTNTGLKLVLEDSYFKNNKSLILKKYFDNFFFIKKKIDYIIQSLIDKISTIPYTVRCICKVISLLMYKKFPLLPKYLRNSFLGKFIFDKCIFPVLSFENKNVMDSRIFSSNTKKCLNVIISVLSNANRCCLYPTTTDTEKTIFNYYLIEIIPILNQFYEKVIDIELPKALEDLVSQVKLKIEQNIDNKIFNFRRKNDKKRYPTEVEKKKKKEPATKEIEILFDYFKENDDEIMHLESICFSLSDILFILELIKRKAKIFEGLPKYDFFKKTCERIQFDDFKLNEQVKKNANIKQFFIIFRDEKNSQLEKLLRSNKKNISTFITGNQDSDLICKRIKFCIKTILKGLNLLNNKDYSYLNKAVFKQIFFPYKAYFKRFKGVFRRAR